MIFLPHYLWAENENIKRYYFINFYIDSQWQSIFCEAIVHNLRGKLNEEVIGEVSENFALNFFVLSSLVMILRCQSRAGRVGSFFSDVVAMWMLIMFVCSFSLLFK